MDDRSEIEAALARLQKSESDKLAVVARLRPRLLALKSLAFQSEEDLADIETIERGIADALSITVMAQQMEAVIDTELNHECK